MGDDWKGKFDYLKRFCDVIYLKRTKEVSTTRMKKSLENMLTLFEEIINNIK